MYFCPLRVAVDGMLLSSVVGSVVFVQYAFNTLTVSLLFICICCPVVIFGPICEDKSGHMIKPSRILRTCVGHRLHPVNSGPDRSLMSADTQVGTGLT